MRFHFARRNLVLLATPFAALVACSGGSGGHEDVGEATAEVTQVPPQVSCIDINVSGSRTVDRHFDVTSGQSTVLSLSQLPTGNVIFTGFAYALPCAKVTPATTATWLSDPTPASLTAGTPTNVTVILRPNGQANLGVDFQGDDGGAPDAAVTPPLCGNGVLELGEQCDDGNATNLDGCSATCRFEQEQRATSLKMQFGTDMFCTANHLGGAIAATAQANIQGAYDTSVQNGSLTMGFAFGGLGDLTGGGTQMVQLGSLSGAPSAAPMGVTYSGASDLDWWYTTNAASIDVNRNPLQSLSAVLSSGSLTAGPGSLKLPLAFGSATPVGVSSVRLRATIGAATTPTLSASGASPGHTASEHLDPSLQSFGSLTAGELCGNVSAASLAQVPAPAGLQMQCGKPSASMLDLIVTGCTVSLAGIAVVAVVPTQGDQVDPSVPPVGAGGPYTLSADSTGHVSACVDKTGASASLSACLSAVGYSSAFTFATDRVIFK